MRLPTAGGLIVSAALAFLLAACGAFQGDPAVRLNQGGPDVASRWNATLTTPRELEGALDMSGTAWMLSPDGASTTDAAIQISNAAPGGTHPWEIQRGRCGERGTVLGSSDAYDALDVDEDGLATAQTTLDVAPNPNGTYHVVVLASSTNRDLIVACGNLAPPSN